MSQDKLLFVGIDDGYAETKISLSSGECIRIPSQAKAGEMNQISLGSYDTTVFPYHTSEGNFIIGDIREADSTSFDDYPVSALNRVIVHHALHVAGIDPSSKLMVCSGLPIKKFYLTGRINKVAVVNKKNNLIKNDVVSLLGHPLPVIMGHEIISEGIAAWMDIVMKRRGDGSLFVDKELSGQRMAIIDIGGRTTDIAVIQNGNLDISRSSTINAGMLAVKESVYESITGRFEITPSVDQMNDVMTRKQIKLWGHYEDAADLVSMAQQSVVSRIHSECKRCLGNAADLDRVIFVGGTVADIGHHLSGWFKNQQIGENPEFANARGMQKYVEIINQI